jgi:acyl dehydratase
VSEPLILRSVADYQAAVGRTLGPSEWLTVEQSRIDAFAEATGDHQWIHLDAARAAHGPFGATIAHGFLTLSLVSYFRPQLLRIEGARHVLNYGCDRVRFPGVVRVGVRLRARAEILSAEDLGSGAVQVKTRFTVEAEKTEKPVCVAETLNRVYFASSDGRATTTS